MLLHGRLEDAKKVTRQTQLEAGVSKMEDRDAAATLIQKVTSLITEYKSSPLNDDIIEHHEGSECGVRVSGYVRACMCVWLSSYDHGLATQGCEFKHQPWQEIFVSCNILFPHQSTTLQWGPGIFWGENSLAMVYLSAKGSGGISGAHTYKLRVLVSPPASS